MNGGSRRGVWILAILVIVAIAGFYLFSAYNRLVTLDEGIKAAWAQIDNQLQRRADLIPNLVETTKGFAAQERTILEAIANARARLAGARDPRERVAASDELSGVLSRLLVVVENYPQLKSDATFIRLMDELAGTENRLSVERKRYNDRVVEFNQTIRRFPGSAVAGLFGFERAQYFEIPAAARTAPRVDFSPPKTQ